MSLLFPDYESAGSGLAKNAPKKKGIKLYYPELKYCTDNAAMIASCGYYEYMNGKRDTLDLNAYPSLQM